MAHYDMVIQDAENPPGSPKYVWITMEDPWLGAKTWTMSGPNSWSGTGSGEYDLVGFNKDVIEFRDGPFSNGNMRMQFMNVNYPDDCRPKIGQSPVSGGGIYSPVYQAYSARFRNLRWIGTNIVADNQNAASC